ncbi:hypothetical protein BZG36_03860 [Bifiguratus adelaidae]|uniref:Uncharacterized protein n=1 Tax=Bifiguratus adelaidae TaxID=1938954 RepID=A0A261XWI2_9FUNG|nr:hypothetical protein BZG36_03860 [Bifiguratus adelaidae]
MDDHKRARGVEIAPYYGPAHSLYDNGMKQQLITLGMRVRKAVTEGYKHDSSFKPMTQSISTAPTLSKAEVNVPAKTAKLKINLNPHQRTMTDFFSPAMPNKKRPFDEFDEEDM